MSTKYCTEPDRPPKMRYCKLCVYPASSAVPLAFNEQGVCTGCQVALTKTDINWESRLKRLKKLADSYKGKGPYDCVIPVSGGKDSYYQIHVMKYELGLTPLLVTYNSNNYTDVGMQNLENMRDAFGVDHIFFTPSVETLKKMNRLGMQIMGDMNWHGHAGMFTYPIRAAVQNETPLMVWGEHGFMDLGGMHSYNDFVEFTYRYRHEHSLRGYEWYDFVRMAPEYGETLDKKDMVCWMHPTDEEIERVGVRGIFLTNYVYWNANKHTELMKSKYGFKESEEGFERTYRTASNLDDMHENGIHDYMKYIKFGYGRASDHVSKDIRSGRLTREQGIEIVRKMDHIKSKDLYRWLEYVGWTEEKFDTVADTFRDPRVWWKTKDGEWKKDNIWD